VSLNILVVDDSSVMRKMIVRTLEMSGLPLGEVHQAPDGAKGLALLDAHWIDLALIDIHMPVMDGEEMIARVRATPDIANLPIVVVSSESSEARIERLRERVAGFVHKPFTPEGLRATVNQALGIVQ
jgi:two-component system chemotaxis response regulator CheY